MNWKFLANESDDAYFVVPQCVTCNFMVDDTEELPVHMVGNLLHPLARAAVLAMRGREANLYLDEPFDVSMVDYGHVECQLWLAWCTRFCHRRAAVLPDFPRTICSPQYVWWSVVCCAQGHDSAPDIEMFVRGTLSAWSSTRDIDGLRARSRAYMASLEALLTCRDRIA